MTNLPRVTYSNTGEDFSGVHAHLDEIIPEIETRLLGKTRPALMGGRDRSEGAVVTAVSPIDRSIVLRDERFVDRDAKAAGALRRVACACMVDEHPTHGLRRGAKEMRSVGKGNVGAREAKERLVDQRRGLKRVVRPLAAHVPRGNRVKLVVDQRKEPLIRGRIPATGRREDVRDRVVWPGICGNGSTPAAEGTTRRGVCPRRAARFANMCSRIQARYTETRIDAQWIRSPIGRPGRDG